MQLRGRAPCRPVDGSLVEPPESVPGEPPELIAGVVLTWMSTGASVSPAPAHACVIATGLAVGLMLACPAAEPPSAPFSVNAAIGPTVASEMVNLIVPY